MPIELFLPEQIFRGRFVDLCELARPFDPVDRVLMVDKSINMLDAGRRARDRPFG